MKILSLLFPPKKLTFKPGELNDTKEYQCRLARRGVFVHRDHIPVVSIGKAKFKRIIYLSGRVV